MAQGVFSDVFSSFLKIVKNFEMIDEPGVALFLEKILLDVSLLSQTHINFLNDFFQTEEQKKRIIVKLLKTVLSNEEMLLKYWNKSFRTKTGVDYIVQTHMSLYPYDSTTLIRTASALIGQRQACFAEELKLFLMDLDMLTVESSKPPEFYEDTQERDGFRNYLSARYETKEGIIIPPKTPVASVGGNLYCCKLKFNFLTHLFREIVDILRDLKANLTFPVREQGIPFIKLFASLVVADPSCENLFGAADGDNEDVSSFSTIVLVLLELLAALKQLPENVALVTALTEALEALLSSSNARVVRHLLASQTLYSDIKANPLDCLTYFQKAEEDPQIYRLLEKKHLACVSASLSLVNALFSDVDFFACQLQSFGKRLSDDKSRAVDQLELLVLNNDFLASSALVEKSVNALLERPPYSGIIDDFLDKTLFALCRRVIRDEFDAQAENVAHKYLVYSKLVNLLITLVDCAKAEEGLPLVGFGSLTPKLMEQLSKLPLLELIVEAFLPRVNSEFLEQGRLNAIENKHFLDNVKQRKIKSAERNIVLFLKTSLDLLALLVEFVKTMHKDYHVAFRSLIAALAEKESLYSYIFTGVGVSYKICIILSIASLLELPVQATLAPLTFAEKHIDSLHWEHSEDLFSNQEHLISGFLASVDSNLLLARIFGLPSRLYKTKALSNAVFKAFGAFVDLWAAQERTRKIAFIDCIGSLGNEIPYITSVTSLFLFKIIAELFKPGVEVLDFLQACCRSQPRFIEELTRKRDDSEELPLIKAIETSFENYQEDKITRRLLRLSVALYTSTRNRRELQDRLSHLVLDKLFGFFFENIKQSEDVANRIVSFCNNLGCSGREDGALLANPPPNIPAVNLNLLATFQMLTEETVLDQLIFDFCQVLLTALMNRPRSATNFIPMPSNLVKSLAAALPRLLELTSGPTLIALLKLNSSFITDYLPCLLNELTSEFNLNSYSQSGQSQNQITFGSYHRGDLLNAKDAFTGLRLSGVADASSHALAVYCSLINITTALLKSKMIVHRCIQSLDAVLLSVGLTGNFCGAVPALAPAQNLTFPAYELALDLRRTPKPDQKSDFENLSNQLLQLVGKGDSWEVIQRGRAEFNLKPKEKQLYFPFHRENMFGFNVLSLLAPGSSKFNEETIHEAFCQVNGQLTRLVENLDYFCKQFSIFDDYSEKIDQECFPLLESLMKLGIFSVNLHNHIFTNTARAMKAPPTTNENVITLLQLMSKMCRFLDYQ